ncbi:MAG TPA: DNA topoisomerase VI subunit B [Phycisphaerae bacterium]|nr:DNA topoisomerase VI subunit B [Phycisphaerales bacterium]HRX85544.1 DNA topoisomerase VI subunit B [Phycisphaerae bacterium]
MPQSAKARSKPTQGKKKAAKASGPASAETMAAQQREISVAEFFARNRHLLGFDNKRKALLTSVKEAVDNALDACEEAGVLPEIHLEIRQLSEDRFRMICRDNGPGIVKQQIPNIFGKLLYGSKFHRLKMSRGQQGIGISAAGMYGLLTTGKPVSIVSKTGAKKPAHHYKLAIDTKKNKPDIIEDREVEVPWERGTEIEIEMVAGFNRGRQSVFEYIDQTAIANPHAAFTFKGPTGELMEYPRATEELPRETREIKPHPHGIELGVLMKMLKETRATQVGAFLQQDFSRVSSSVAGQICQKAGITARTWVNTVDPQTAEKLYQALQDTRLRAPSTDCLAPIGAEAILSGLLKGIKAEFYTASTRPPTVYRGNPFQIEVGVAFGGDLGGSSSSDDDDNGSVGKKAKDEPAAARVIRFANRVPLLYQQSACSTYKSVIETKWNNYGLSQARGAIPQAPVVILIHMASVWVPFTSESKEAIADYDEIRKEIKLAIAECGRRLGIYLRRKKRRAHFSQRRDVFHKYIDEVVEACRAMATFNKDEFRRSLVSLAEQATAHADIEFDEHGNMIQPKEQAERTLEHTVIVDREGEPPAGQLGLFATESADTNGGRKKKRAKAAKGKTKKAKSARKR